MALANIGDAVSALRGLGPSASLGLARDGWLGAGAVLAAGAGAIAWGAIAPRSQLFGPTIRRTGRPHSVALTFDDGPNPALTPRLLRLLEENHIHATFFLIGHFVRECPALVQEIAAAGHTIGNHTDTHPALLWMTPARIADELARCQDAIEKACGQRPVWMRPPFGIRGPQLFPVVRRAGFQGVVMWSRGARDWKPPRKGRDVPPRKGRDVPPRKGRDVPQHIASRKTDRDANIAQMVHRLRRVRGGDILLLHDGDYRRQRGDRQNTLASLDSCLPLWKSAGLQFVTLDDIAAVRDRK